MTTPTPARPALDEALAKVKAFLAFDSFPSDEASSPTFEALRVVIDDYDRVVRSLADMRETLAKIAEARDPLGDQTRFATCSQLREYAVEALARSAP